MAMHEPSSVLHTHGLWLLQHKCSSVLGYGCLDSCLSHTTNTCADLSLGGGLVGCACRWSACAQSMPGPGTWSCQGLTRTDPRAAAEQDLQGFGFLMAMHGACSERAPSRRVGVRVHRCIMHDTRGPQALRQANVGGGCPTRSCIVLPCSIASTTRY